jgi:hypothetical protein
MGKDFFSDFRFLKALSHISYVNIRKCKSYYFLKVKLLEKEIENEQLANLLGLSY